VWLSCGQRRPPGSAAEHFPLTVGRRALDKWIGRAIAIFVRLETNNGTKSTFAIGPGVAPLMLLKTAVTMVRHGRGCAAPV
jgi:hypothetical protein